jgi:hypothetical protein
MCAILPVDQPGVDQAHVRLVDQRGSIPAGGRLLLSGMLPPKPAQVVVNERRQAVERLFVAAPPRLQQRRDIAIRWSRHAADFPDVCGQVY